MTIEQFKEHKDTFLIHLEVERNVSNHTLRAYKSDLELFIIFYENMPDTDKMHLSLRQMLERYLVSLYHNKIDKSSIARKFSCFRSFSRFLETAGINLKLNLKRPRIAKKLPVHLSIEEIFHLLDTVPDSELPSSHPTRDKAIFELMYATGIRCAELTTIKLRDINMQEKTIRIQGKGRKERIVLFGSKALSKINEYLSKERPPSASLEEPLFLSGRNQALTTRSVQRIFEMFRTFLQVDKNLTPHKVRHSFATHMLNQGVDIRIVQELLGHQTLSSTEKYTHVSLNDLITLCDTIHPAHALMKKRNRKV